MVPLPSAVVDEAMRTAVAVSESARGISTPNPPVGAVILDAEHRVVGTGATAAPGGPHAEVVALREAGAAAAGGTAVVTLEPCDHTGRTGPCTQALLAAGVARVVHALADPTPTAAGGAETLTRAGVVVESGRLADEVARGPLRFWLHRQRTGRPHVTLKLASTLDGRIAAPDGTSRWITGPAARAAVHAERARLDAIVVGTGTVLADDPALTARADDGTLAVRQPLRVVVGRRKLPAGLRVLDDTAPTRVVREHDPQAVLAALDDLNDVLVEGGATLAGAFLGADLVDRLVLYLAPTVLGAGRSAVESTSVGTLADARGFRRESVTALGDDLRLDFVPVAVPSHPAAAPSHPAARTQQEQTCSPE
ncbi:bifunctional diaminohydroxyphosphoribosylaminopyrimidine deaminase/5-amino-6-(5-phosphoribosylamino)uracil reductase RibD [Rhodococcoides corynebacterioides]|uniref:Riboflavin biosynthesis protein RibD n=2 Tax=Rhodococcoides corynebacterioides TaxID=53972 RepID=A0ABS7P1E2_9NOCA|nr:bifunctional diaminohydroxyphosphoribosylaminopyrimidine deaminase/5-amino-6-(5-phosphoribosylamino)uracil reductase RibD [Rhodococcus corynebacterioides]MBY6366225.1 bifunctional diaminohydroxyphosphoribosylaminopyrimidine deaminase/5-amino-6-(5-phosphoribosylamino)uracil reductase RibD [Rhodococcus corynebacterioides]